eukprot:Clim_evm6s33 gene=Clim_evmTU6s33
MNWSSVVAGNPQQNNRRKEVSETGSSTSQSVRETQASTDQTSSQQPQKEEFPSLDTLTLAPQSKRQQRHSESWHDDTSEPAGSKPQQPQGKGSKQKQQPRSGKGANQRNAGGGGAAPGSGGLDLSAFIRAAKTKEDIARLKQEKAKAQEQLQIQRAREKLLKEQGLPGSKANRLDTSAPTKLRGKEREKPKRKRPTRLKKALHAQRMERRGTNGNGSGADHDDGHGGEDDDDQQHSDSGDETGADAEDDADVVDDPNDQNQHPDVANDDDVDDDVDDRAATSTVKAGKGHSHSKNGHDGTTGVGLSNRKVFYGPVYPAFARFGLSTEAECSLHSRKFREYCRQYTNVDGLKGSIRRLLADLQRFEQRVRNVEPQKLRQKKRLVVGIRQVEHWLGLGRLKGVILAPDLEANDRDHGLDAHVRGILDTCKTDGVELIIGPSRYKMGQPMSIRRATAVVGIVNYDGAQEHWQTMLECAKVGREKYEDAVRERLAAAQAEFATGNT